MSIHLPPTNDFHDLSVQEKLFYDSMKKFSEESKKKLATAYASAKAAHDTQMRDDGTPYILHPLRATISLMSECGTTSSDILSAMLLHDVIEDTPVTYDHIERDFGHEVAHLVQNVTRPRTTCQDEEVIRQEKAKKYLALMDADESTRLIKCADVLDNVRSWPNIPCGSIAQKKLPRWHMEVRDYALPLAQKTHSVLFNELSTALTFAQQNKDLCVSSHS